PGSSESGAGRDEDEGILWSDGPLCQCRGNGASGEHCGHGRGGSQAQPHQLGVTSGARVDEVGSGRQRGSPGAGRHRIPDRAGSVLPAHCCGTVPRTTWIRGWGKGTAAARLTHLMRKRPNGTGGKLAGWPLVLGGRTLAAQAAGKKIFEN